MTLHVLSEQLVIHRLDASDFLLDLFSFGNHLCLFMLHPAVHFLELLLLSLELFVLLIHDLLVIVQKVSHFLEFFFLKDLKPAEAGLNFVRRWYGSHFCDRSL